MIFSDSHYCQVTESSLAAYMIAFLLKMLSINLTKHISKFDCVIWYVHYIIQQKTHQYKRRIPLVWQTSEQ